MSVEMLVEDEVAGLLVVRGVVERRLHAMAEHRPPLTLKDVCADRCNISDRTVRASIARMMERYDSVNTGDLDTDDIDKWELITTGDRFVAREYQDEEGETWWGVFDTEYDDDRVEEEILTEDEATNEAEQRNRDHTMESLVGFPFAQTYGYEISGYEVAQFSAAGFLVWLYDGDRYIAGIDGGGYSFEGAHFAPLYFAKMSGGIIETDGGPRRVE